MRVYSPSQTTAHLENAANRYLRYVLGWRPRYLETPDLAAILGSAVSAGLAEFNRGLREAGPTFAPLVLGEMAATVAEREAKAELKRLVSHGLTYRERETETIGRLPGRAHRALMDYAHALPLPANWRILHVEPILEEYGRARPDLVVQLPTDAIAVLDYKTKRTLDGRYRDKNVDEYRWSWQMHHYVWALSKYLDQPVTQYFHGILVLEPKFDFILDAMAVDPEIMQLWEQSAVQTWADMEAVDEGYRLPVHPFTFYTKYGRDRYRDALLAYKWDENLMREGYIKVPREVQQ